MRSDDPDLRARFREFNSGVARARMEYEAHPLLRGGWGKTFWGTRVCPSCGDNHKSKRHELCWRCIIAAKTTTKETSK